MGSHQDRYLSTSELSPRCLVLSITNYVAPLRPFTVFAISKDVGTVGADFTDPAIWAVGMLRDPAVAYLTPDGTIESRHPYWKAAHNTPQDAVSTITAVIICKGIAEHLTAG